jgi:hypothetical protein
MRKEKLICFVSLHMEAAPNTYVMKVWRGRLVVMAVLAIDEGRDETRCYCFYLFT